MLVKMYRSEEPLVSGEIIYVKANDATRNPRACRRSCGKRSGLWKALQRILRRLANAEQGEQFNP